ncbi:MAG: 50S ribosomal protein L25 [Acidimicrobiales bacterium]
MFNLDLDGTPTPVILKDLQRNAVKRTVEHCDFLRVDNDVPVKVTLPVHLVGRASKILDTGGIVEQKMFQMRVKCAPNNIPISIEVDVSKLTPDSRISVGDIDLPEGVTALMGDRITVAAPVVTAQDGAGRG